MDANRALLADHGIDLGPLYPWSCGRIPFHGEFWSALPGKPPSRRLATLLEQLKEQTQSSRDVLLLSGNAELPNHRALALLLRQYLDLGRYEVHCVYVMGQPLCLLERCWRKVARPSADAVEQHLESFGALSRLITEARHEWGERNVTLLYDTWDSPVAGRNDELAHGLFAALGCPAPQAPAHLPLHPLFLASHAARRLYHSLEVRDNAWPALDEGLFMDCLVRTERDWGAEPMSPRVLRQRLIREGADDRRALEDMLNLPGGALEPSDWMAERREADFDAPLPGERAAAFAAALPDELRIPLRQRFILDAPLLSDDQKTLDRALAAYVPASAVPAPGRAGASPGEPAAVLPSSAAPVSRIGEPVPPVELTVLTMTYNHEAYIAQCMDSVLAQRTKFPVRHLVLDHHSTDGTPAIVAAYAAKYPSITPVLLSCRRPTESVRGLFLRCRTKYASLCDGDDYFTEPSKLQQQVDFLESRPHCALCFHPVAVVFEDGSQETGIFPPMGMLPRGMQDEYYLADLLRGNMIQTNSVVYRWRFREGVPGWFRPDLCPGDWYWHMLHAEVGKIGFIPEVMSVYRRHKNAMYRNSFVNQREHRRHHGMAELETYNAVNDHFQGRYFLRLASLANGVFIDFFEIQMDEGDDSLLNLACDRYPEFARHFLKSLKLVRREKSSS